MAPPTSWPATAVLLILLSSTASTTTAFLPLTTTTLSKTCSSSCNTASIYRGSYHAGTSLLPVAATPVSPTSSAARSANSTSGDHSGNKNHPTTNSILDQFRNLQEANVALDALAMKCGNHPSVEPVIVRADECQSQWEAMMRSGRAGVDDHNNDHSSLKPDTVSFNTVLKAWSRCCHSLADQKRNEQQQQLSPLSASLLSSSSSSSDSSSGFAAADGIMSPGGVSIPNPGHPPVYTAKDAAERATLLLLSQEQHYLNGDVDDTARPDTVSYNEVIGAWAKSGVAEAPHNAERLLKRMLDHDYIRPDGISYNGVVDAWAYSGKPESVQKVKQIWQHMEQLYATASNDGRDDNRAPIKPTIRTVNSIIQAHSKRVQEFMEQRDSDSARRVAREAEEYLILMKERYDQTKDPDHRPDAATYTAVIDTLGRCGRYHSTLRAQGYLEELKESYDNSKHKNPKLKPSVRTYTAVISAWSRTRSHDSPREAERILAEMRDSRDPDLQPNARTFTGVIHAWGRSADHDKAQRALKLLQTMKELHKATGNEDVKPTLVSYNAALDACARCQGDLRQQTDALKIAFAIFKAIQLDPSIEPTTTTFATLLRACSFLLQPGDQRNIVAKSVFEKARKAGMVDFRVLLQLKKTASASLLQELLDGVEKDRQGNFDFNNIPPGWSRNVR